MAEDSLEAPADQTSSPGPSEPRHLMYRTYPSTPAIWVLVGYCAVVAVAIGLLGLDSYGWITDPCYTSDCPNPQAGAGTLPAGQDAESATPTPSATAAPAGSPSPGPQSPGSVESPAPVTPPPTTTLPTTTPTLPTNTGSGGYAGPRSPDTDLLILVALAGALGGLVHVLTSLGRYIGERRFLRSWVVFYYLRPPAGAGLAIGTYFVLRMATPSVGVKQLNLFSILAFAVLSGLFARQAIEKLAQIFDTMFLKVEKKVEAEPIDKLLYHAKADEPLDLESEEPETKFRPEEDVSGPPNRKDA